MAGIALLPLAVLAFELAFRASAKAEFGTPTAGESAGQSPRPTPVIELSDRSAGTVLGRRFEQVRPDLPVRAA
ncbi:MAG TPA: hypothetical protein VFA94_15535 [Acidimicrobiales bacterium]|nr:hypothetical protein [Acidimicrobiales bacterium]